MNRTEIDEVIDRTEDLLGVKFTPRQREMAAYYLWLAEEEGSE